MKYLGPEAEILHERYARALIAVAETSKKLDQVKDDLSLASSLIRENAELSKILLHPEIDKKEKTALLDNICRKVNFCSEIHSFVNVLVKNNRLGLIHGVFLRYRDFYERKKGILKVFITTADALDSAQKMRLKSMLKDAFKKEIALEEIIDPSLIGGFNLRIKGVVHNLSLASRVQLIKKGLNA